MKPLALALVAMLATPGLASAWRNYPRDPEVPRAFQRSHPCPSTGASYGHCPGYIRDHVVPLCAGGPDSPTNMQWQTLSDSLAKDDQERALCRSLHRRH